MVGGTGGVCYNHWNTKEKLTDYLEIFASLLRKLRTSRAAMSNLHGLNTTIVAVLCLVLYFGPHLASPRAHSWQDPVGCQVWLDPVFPLWLCSMLIKSVKGVLISVLSPA